MTNLEFVEILKKITEQTKTQYATGAFGAVVGLYNNRERYAKNSSKSTAAKIMAADPDTFMFDCINKGKSVLWGFDFDLSSRYGGANYKANDVPDFGVKSLPKYCTEWTEDGCKDPLVIDLGEWLATSDWTHVAFYIGDCMIDECTQKGDCKCRIAPLSSRKWAGHGKIKYLNYTNRKKGDVNGDGKIDARDYMLCKRIVLKTYIPTAEEKWAADINNDGKVSALDYLRLKRMVLKNE